jgi:hypothetical protein
MYGRLLADYADKDGILSTYPQPKLSRSDLQSEGIECIKEDAAYFMAPKMLMCFAS